MTPNVFFRSDIVNITLKVSRLYTKMENDKYVPLLGTYVFTFDMCRKDTDGEKSCYLMKVLS